jgi:hypothetical protein
VKRNPHRTIYNTYGCCLMVAVAGMALGSPATRDATAADAVGLSVNISVGSASSATTHNNTQIKGKLAVLNSGGNADLTGTVVQADKVQGYMRLLKLHDLNAFRMPKARAILVRMGSDFPFNSFIHFL